MTDEQKIDDIKCAIEAIKNDGAREILNKDGSRVGVSKAALDVVLDAAFEYAYRSPQAPSGDALSQAQGVDLKKVEELLSVYEGDRLHSRVNQALEEIRKVKQ